MNFTDSQKEAINHLYGPAIVIAGPGAGKTRVVTERVKMLLNDQKVNLKTYL